MAVQAGQRVELRAGFEKVQTDIDPAS